MKATLNQAGRHWRVVKHIRGQRRINWFCWIKPALCLALFISLVVPNAALAEGYVETFNKGVDYYRSGDLPAALDAFTEARDMNPRDPSVRRNLAIINTRLHRFNEAESELLGLIALQDTVENQLSLAELYVGMGKHANALSIYQNVLSKDDSNAQALLGSVISNEALGDLQAAADYYQRVIEYYPRSKQAKNATGRLSRITKAQKVEETNKYFPIDSSFGEAGLGWWNLRRMPLHVYIDNGDGVTGYRSEMRDVVTKAVTAWTAASNDNISFIIDGTDSMAEAAWKDQDDAKPILLRMQENMASVPNDPIPAQIHIHW